MTCPRRLKVVELSRGDPEQACGAVKDSTTRGFVAIERVWASIIGFFAACG